MFQGYKNKEIKLNNNTNNTDNLPITVAMYTQCHKLLFNSCWNVRVIHNLSSNINHITPRHLELGYQLILSSKHSLGLTPDNLFNFPTIHTTPPFFLLLPWWLLLETITWRHLYCVFTYIYSHLLRQSSLSIQTYQLSFRGFFLFIFFGLLSGESLIFSVRVSFLFLFLYKLKNKLLR